MLRLSNEKLTLDFSKNGHALAQVTDHQSGHAFLSADAAVSLWEAALMDGTTFQPTMAATVACSTRGDNCRAGVATWSGFNLPGAPNLKVTVHIALEPDESESRWRIRFDGLGDEMLRTVAFPRLGSIAPQEGEVLAVPEWLGEATAHARAMLNPAEGKADCRSWEYPGLASMQFLTLYGARGPGVMLSTNDTTLTRKDFAVEGDGQGGLLAEVVHFVPVTDTGNDHFEPGYDVLIRTFEGDWFTAAEAYRRWAADQWWTEQSRVRTGKTPAWMRDTGIWVWNRGESPDVLDPAAALQAYADLPVNVFWHWWHGCAYDLGFPEYLPPREGAEAFRTAVADARAKGIHPIVYMNLRLWGMRTDSWTDENAERFAVKRPDGSIGQEVYNTFDPAPCATMCLHTSFWRDTYAGLAEEAIRDLGVAGIYMDQACLNLACYDAAHGHPLGGGTYWVEGFDALAEDIRSRTADVNNAGLAGEGCGEAWLPHLDVMLTLQVSLERYMKPNTWYPIPLFNAVYHDVATQYGNYASLTSPPYDNLWPKEFAPAEPLVLLDPKFNTQFRMEQARSFLWGQQLTLANFREEHLESRKSEIDFVVRLARTRQHMVKYFRDGLFLRPPQIDTPHRETPVSRLSIYAGQRDAVQEYTKNLPMVLSSAWQAKDGDVALALVNISDEAVPIRYTMTKNDYPIPPSGLVVDAGKAVAYHDGRISLDLTLAPYDIRVIEATSAQN
jgi:hypothetical protein